MSRHLEEVQVALEALGDKSATLRGRYLAVAATRPDEMWPRIHEAEDAFQSARAAIARLGMQPSADKALVTTADDAAKAHHAAVRTVRAHQLNADTARATGQLEPIEPEAAGTVIEKIESGYEDAAIRGAGEGSDQEAARLGTSAKTN